MAVNEPGMLRSTICLCTHYPGYPPIKRRTQKPETWPSLLPTDTDWPSRGTEHQNGSIDSALKSVMKNKYFYIPELNKALEIWPLFEYKDRLSRYVIPIIKVWRSWDHIKFMMGIPCLERGNLYIEPTTPTPTPSAAPFVPFRVPFHG